MKVADYKGYEIGFYDGSGQFSVEGIAGWFDTYKQATTKIDAIIKAEVKDNFPIDVVISSMKVGKITSYNKLEKAAWFTPDEKGGGRERSKERLTGYSGKPCFYKANENNLQIVKHYTKLSNEISKLNKEQRDLEKQLTEPITFDTEG